MGIRLGFVIACSVLAVSLIARRLGKPLPNDHVVMGAAGFWVLMLGGGIMLAAIF